MDTVGVWAGSWSGDFDVGYTHVVTVRDDKIHLLAILYGTSKTDFCVEHTFSHALTKACHTKISGKTDVSFLITKRERKQQVIDMETFFFSPAYHQIFHLQLHQKYLHSQEPYHHLGFPILASPETLLQYHLQVQYQGFL